MFVDAAVATFSAGKGGDGCASFRREKFIPRGGPDGGDGGRGGHVFLISSERCGSLVDYRFTPHVRAENGQPGMGALKTGRSGKDEYCEVPVGTVVKTLEGDVLFDFDAPGMTFMIAQGGAPGKGNTRFKTSTNQAPRKKTQGKPGESIRVELELKLLAFAGLVGFPNAGKSTLISRLSAARPKIADYPFTTLHPHLGVVDHHGRSLVMADIPGIIEGASEGAGMGLDFLRHIERNRVLLFVLDVSPYAQPSADEAFRILRQELTAYRSRLSQKPFLVLANKIDLLVAEGDDAALGRLRRFCGEEGLELLEISAFSGVHLDILKDRLFALDER